MDSSDVLGSVDFLAVEFPVGMTGAGFRHVRQLVEAGVIAVLDLEFVAKDSEGTVSRVALDQVPGLDVDDIGSWAGTYSGILDESDLAMVTQAVQPGRLAGILVYENVWVRPIMAEITASGSRLLGGGRIDTDDLAAALGVTEDDG